MDKNTQQEVTLACIALLQQNAADEEKAGKRMSKNCWGWCRKLEPKAVKR